MKPRAPLLTRLVALSVIAACAASAEDVRPALPPKWAFGVLFGTYHDQQGVQADMARLRNENYCGDLIWIDSSWLSSHYDGEAPYYIDFKFDSGQFADPAGMIRTLRANHFHFGVWEWPFIDRANALYAYGAAHRLFVTDAQGRVVNAGGWHGVKFTGQFDFTNPAAVAWWDELNAPLVAMGVDFFKLDTGGEFRAPGVPADGDANKEDFRFRYHKAAYDLSAGADGPEGRGFILTHTGPATGNLRTPGMWTGDTPSSWEGFRDRDMGGAAKLDTADTAAYWCGDTGGYDLAKNPQGGKKLDSTDELYVRWLEYSTFTPIQEFFSSKPAKGRFPWNFGPQAQRIFRRFTSLRYQLLPFRYSNAQAAYHETPVRFPVHFIGKTQLVVGNGASEILVQPVTSPGQSETEVRLPEGPGWIDLWSDQAYPGGATAHVATPLEREPIFVKAGSIIPMGPPMHYVDEVRADPLIVDIYPAGRTSYTFYEDDGKTTAYQHGAYARTLFTSDAAGGGETVTVSATKGDYAGKPAARTYVLKIHGQASAPGAVTLDGQAVHRSVSSADWHSSDSAWVYLPSVHLLWVRIHLPADRAATVVCEPERG